MLVGKCFTLTRLEPEIKKFKEPMENFFPSILDTKQKMEAPKFQNFDKLVHIILVNVLGSFNARLKVD